MYSENHSDKFTTKLHKFNEENLHLLRVKYWLFWQYYRRWKSIWNAIRTFTFWWLLLFYCHIEAHKTISKIDKVCIACIQRVQFSWKKFFYCSSTWIIDTHTTYISFNINVYGCEYLDEKFAFAKENCLASSKFYLNLLIVGVGF